MSNSQETALWIIAICMVIQTVASLRTFMFTKKSMGRMEEFRNKTPDRNPKHKEIKQTMDSGRYKEALTMSLELQQTNPGDAYAWYYAGVCNYHLKNLGEAREQLQKAQLMSPMWEKEWTGPYLRAIEQQAGETKN